MMKTFLTAALLISVIGGSLSAQFGRNKVRYDYFDFQVLSTDNFDIYFYPVSEATARDAARMLERWYIRLSGVFGYEFSERSPIIFYADKSDFHQTNVLPIIISQGVGGVTEGMKRRVVLPFDGSYSDINHIIGHELSHVFHFKLALDAARQGGPGGMGETPLWFIEGMSEYLSLGGVSPQTSMWIRDALARDEVPGAEDLTRRPDRYFPYRWGHALWAYVGAVWGDEVIGPAYRDAVILGWRRALTERLGITPEELSQNWQDAIREEYAPLIEDRVLPEYAGERIETGTSVNLSPSISPDGRHLAFLSRLDVFTIDLYLYDLEERKLGRRVSSSFREGHFDELRFIDTSGTWAPDGKLLAFPVFSEGRTPIAIFDVASGDIERIISFPDDIDTMINPSWSPAGRHIAFTGSRGGRNNLYVYDMHKDRIRQLTDDRHSDMQPAWSPDGRIIAASSDRSSATNFGRLEFGGPVIALFDLDSGDLEIIDAFPGSGHTNPQFSPDGGSVYFVSDYAGFSDIYRYSRDSGEVFRVTNIVSGVSGLAPGAPALTVSPATGDMIFSVFQEGGYKLNMLRAEDAAGTLLEDEIRTAAALPPGAAREDGAVERYLAAPEEGLPPPVTAAAKAYSPVLRLDFVGTAGGIAVSNRFGTALAGGVGAQFSDMLGDHVLGIDARLMGNIENAGLQAYYLNRFRRTSWGILGSRIPYLTSRVRAEDTTVITNGSESSILEVTQTIDRVTENRLLLTTMYPFSRVSRLEVGVSANRIGFDRLERTIEISGGDIISDTESSADAPDALNLYSLTMAYVGDTSYFGFTSPVRGRRFVVELEPTFGSLYFHNILADYRKYFFSRYLSAAIRGIHFGRYGQDAEHERLSFIYAGQSSLIRGYEIWSFDIGLNSSRRMEADLLAGSRIAVANLETRFPLIGTEEYGLLAWGYLPVELAFFLDGAAAWTKDELPRLQIRELSDEIRVPVFSAGAAFRINLLGAAIIEIYYAYPFQHPDSKGHFGLQIIPGW